MDHDAQIGVHQRIVSQSLQAIKSSDVLRYTADCTLLEVTALPQCAPSALIGVEFVLETHESGTAAEKRGRLQLVTLSSSSVVPGFRYLIPTATGVVLLTPKLRFATSYHVSGVKTAIFRFLPLDDAGEPTPPSSRRSLIPRALAPATNVACVACTWEGKQFRFPNRLFKPQ